MKTIKLEVRVWGRADENDSFFSETENMSVECVDGMDRDAVVFLSQCSYHLLDKTVNKWKETRKDYKNEK